MQSKVPASVQGVCRRLRGAGFEAWIVGGAVRDLVLGKTPSDWDVATDALPEAVLGLFEKTIATGLQHGTVTALVGRGGARTPVEVTTFRGEGAYSDARRPDRVDFGVPLDEDLKRRDFVMNAMAYDPLDDVVHDPYDGVGDLEKRLIRAVGVAEERFAEDGLRVMRAVRFVSALDFSLHTQTEEALSKALDALSKVAMERVRVELLKLLAGPGALRALRVAERNQVLLTVLPELDFGAFEEALARIAISCPDPVLRLATLLWGGQDASLDALLRHLKMSNEERKRVVAMLRYLGQFESCCSTDQGLREFLSLVGRKAAPDVLALLVQEATRVTDDGTLRAVRRAKEILTSGDALELGELAISGRRLMELFDVRGPIVGETLRALLGAVLQDPRRNEAEYLEKAAVELVSDRA
ncbi:MAG: hypothetical protein GY811_10470 [Myxococcales bacterium]|nr:hypothetical protein [Myxococcales bacterium]